MCEIYNLFILNGIHSPAAYTCHTSRGESTVDYILCSQSLQIKHTPLQVCAITDHDLLHTTLPIPPEMAQKANRADDKTRPNPATTNTQSDDTPTQNEMTTYRWVEGESLKEYSSSAAKWQNYTATPEFATKFRAMLTAYEENNDTRSAKIEEFLLKEAT